MCSSHDAVMYVLVSVVDNCVQPTVMKVLEYHINWLEKTGFTLEQVCCAVQELTIVSYHS